MMENDLQTINEMEMKSKEKEDFRLFSTLYAILSDWRIVEQSNCHIIHNICTYMRKMAVRAFVFYFHIVEYQYPTHNATALTLYCVRVIETTTLIAFSSTRFVLVVSHLQWHFSIPFFVRPFWNDGKKNCW